MTRAAAAFLLAAVLVAAGTESAAQRSSFASTYDTTREVRLEGPVTRIDWVNPAAFLFLDVTDGNGTVTNWAVEVGHPIELERAGAARDDVSIGDVVRVTGVPAWGERRQAFARTIATASGGALFAPPVAPAPSTASSPVPRWPDGQVRLGPPPGETGYWGATGATGLVEDTGTPVEMDRDGLLRNLSDADRVAPFRPWAKALYLQRQRTLLVGDPMTRCIPPGGPRQFHQPNGFQFVEQRDLGRVLVLLGGGNRNWRLIHTDGRPPGQAEEVVLTYYGTSTGRWDGDTLVVDSVGYNESFWFSNGGLPHTEALRLEERFTRTDLHTLRYEVTVDDPRTYTRPWTGGWTVRWVPGEEIQEYFCEENAESTFVR